MVDRDRYRGYLAGHGAHATPHCSSTLLEHLEGTCDLLEAWGSDDHVAVAGLLHTAYGTEGFPYAFHGTGDRASFIEIADREVESLVYFYGSCDRGFLYPQLKRLACGSRRTLAERAWSLVARSVGISRARDLEFRDRFDQRILRPDRALFRDFLELTLANELELIRRAHPLPEAARRHWDQLFRPCLPLLGAAANAAFHEYLSPP